MSEYEFRCGNCGADSPISGVGVLVVVCRFCNWSSVRRGATLETVGEVAQLTPLASRFQIGTEGSFEDRSFEIRGQVQLDHGAGLWNEWAALDSRGEWFWIAEAQGQILVTREVPMELQAKAGKVKLLDEVRIGQHGTFTVTEKGQGQIVTSAGELPVPFLAGTPTRYADLQSGERGVATLDWTRQDQPEVFVGRQVDLDELRLDASSQPEYQPEHIEARRLDCAHCGAGLTIRNPESALRVGCESCGSLLEIEGETTSVLAKEQAVRKKLALPLGAQGELEGEQLTVLGAMERAVKYGGQWYPWREYLCRTNDGAYRWLVESKGHWMRVAPMHYSSLGRRGGRMRSANLDYKHFTSGKAEVRWVLGEFYWRVQTGDKAQTSDYVKGTTMVSTEQSKGEAGASRGDHVEASEIARAFGVQDLPRPSGVGAVQPNSIGARETWILFTAAAMVLLLMGLVRSVSRSTEAVYAASHGPLPSTPGEELVVFTDPFELEGSQANLKISLDARPISQGWVGLSGALVNLESGEVTTFATEGQAYSGVSGGERWSEGNGRGNTILGSIPAGTYRMRLALSGWDKGCGASVKVGAKRNVGRPLYLFLALLALLIPAAIVQIRSLLFEKTRWADSDHPWGESE